jgi:hypothetical protein
MFGSMEVTGVGERRASESEARIAVVCGELNAAHARLVDLVAEVIDSRSWEGQGLRSVEHWVAWQTGLSPARASQVAAIARRRGELPETMTAFANGELAVDQVAAVVTRTPGWADAEMCQLDRHATVTQLRTVVGRYPFPSVDPAPTAGAAQAAPAVGGRCSGIVQPVWERDNVPIGVGRTTRIIPPHTKRMVRRRDQPNAA